MKIHIITGHFYPQIHPRAFRANELAVEFAKQGHTVTVSNCWSIEGFDYDRYARTNGINIVNLGIVHSRLDESNVTSFFNKNNHIGRCLNFLKDYLLAGTTLFRARKLAKCLKIETDVDMIIALSTPFTCILGLSYYLKKHGKNCVVIGDSGDPFYNSKQSPKAPWFYFIEKRAYENLDFLTIPTNNAFSIYSKMISPNRIVEIPQGFRMDVLLYKGEFYPPVKFAYAGVFYWDIRNPEFLFNYLNQCTVPFEFRLYLRCRDNMLLAMLEKYPFLKSKVIIDYNIPRDELLYKLSQMDFLINIENASNTQIPSKLIDYAITERPIFSCKATNFNPTVFERFLSGDYSGRVKIDKEKYDISTIVKQFVNLYNKVKNA